MAKSAEAVTMSALEMCEELLAAKLKECEADPTNYQLGLEKGRLQQRRIALARQAAPKPEYVRAAPAPPALTNAEFADRLREKYQDVCPACGEKLGGYYVRLGALAFRHLSSGGFRNPCSYEGSIDG